MNITKKIAPALAPQPLEPVPAKLMDPSALPPQAVRRAEPVEIPASDLPAPVVTYLVRERAWRLEADYSCLVSGGVCFSVAQGFLFDLASIPRRLWSVIAPFELSIAAPLLHDVLYRYQGEPPAGSLTPPRRYTRAEADRLFLEVMQAEGVAWWRRTAAYLAVRAFGACAWKSTSRFD